MDTVFRCAGDRCVRPACCRLDGDKTFCYIHAACEKQGDLTFLDLNTAKRQATELKHLSAQVWEELVEELNTADAKMAKRTLASAVPPASRLPPPVLQPLAAAEARAKKPSVPRENIWEVAKNLPEQSSLSHTADLLTHPTDIACIKCQSRGTVRYKVVSAAIDASKADTWGTGGRPDRVLQYSCSSCKGSWFVEEG